MKSYRKLTLKSVIDYTVVFTVGVIVGLLVKPKRKRIDEWDWEYWLKTRPLVYDSSGDIDWEKLVWENHSLEDTQEIKL